VVELEPPDGGDRSIKPNGPATGRMPSVAAGRLGARNFPPLVEDSAD